MKAVIQSVLDASVSVDDKVIGKLEKGMLVYFCVEKGDTDKMLPPFLDRLLTMRIFKDENDKMNLDMKASGADILFISQFTLAANVYKGHRPGFDDAAAPDLAETLYNEAVKYIRDKGFRCETGSFGAYMKVRYTNDGPETFLLESSKFIRQ